MDREQAISDIAETWKQRDQKIGITSEKNIKDSERELFDRLIALGVKNDEMPAFLRAADEQRFQEIVRDKIIQMVDRLELMDGEDFIMSVALGSGEMIDNRILQIDCKIAFPSGDSDGSSRADA
jgi:hypothetical protein